jgi:hypothetical protein
MLLNYFTVFNCSSSYERIKDGCYKIVELKNYTWHSANMFCKNEFSLNSGNIHLIAFESKLELFTITKWIKGNILFSQTFKIL